jgi:hypothetical protein
MKATTPVWCNLTNEQRKSAPDVPANALAAQSNLYPDAWLLKYENKIELIFYTGEETLAWSRNSPHGRIANALWNLLEEGELTPMEVAEEFEMESI